MYTVGIIPARGGSKGLPGKNIRLLNGKPMVGWVIEAALAEMSLDRVIVSTDTDDIAAVARAHGAEVIMRPPEISGDLAPIEDALRHVVNTIESQENRRVDLVVLMQANVPIRKPGFVDEVVQALIDSEYTSVQSVYRVNQRPEWMKKEENGRLVPFMQCENYRRQELPDLFLLDGAAEAIRRDVLMNSAGLTGVHTYMGDNVGFCEQERIYSLDVDGLDDFNIVEAIMNYLSSKK